MAVLTKLNNPFDPYDKETKSVQGGLPIHFFLHNEDKDIEFVISINGQITEDYNYILKDEDSLSFVAIPQGGGGGGNKILRTVAMVALVVNAPFLASEFIGATSMAVSATGFYAIQAGIMIAGGLLINAILPPATPNIDNFNKKLNEVSPTYFFDTPSNARNSGTALPLVFGTARVVPPVVGSYLSLQGDKQYLNILMAVNDGYVTDIRDVEINNQPLSNYSNTTYDIRQGLNEQEVIPKFNESILTATVGKGLNTETVATYTTQGNAVNELEIVVSLPKGLFNITDRGDYVSYPVEFKLEYKKTTDSEWISYYDEDDLYDYTYEYDVIVGYEQDAEGSYPIYGRTRTSFDDYRGKSFKSEGKTYTYVNKFPKKSDNPTIRLKSVYKTSKKLAYKFEDLDSAKYDIRITRISSYSTNTRVANDLAFDYVNEINYTKFIYPNVALLSVSAMSTEQLNGGFPAITCIAENLGSEERPLNNPAWACYQLLKIAGFQDKNINVDLFQEWADYCNEKEYECNIYLDSKMSLHEALNMISILGRGNVVQMGSRFAPIIDKVVDIPTQSFLFTSGNASNFNLDYIPLEDRTNVIEITYYDVDNNYKATSVQVQANNFDITKRQIKSKINLYGCTKRQQALNYARFLLNNNQYITETISFEAFIDSIACTVGDIIKVGRKYMSNTVADGRIVSASLNSIKLDTEVELLANESYEIQYRLANDNIIILDVEKVTENTTTDTITTLNMEVNKIPEKFDNYAFGFQSAEATNNYRVISITRRSDLKRKITAIEYNPTIYDDFEYVQVEEVISIDTNIRNINITENIVKNKDKSIDEILTITWDGKYNVSTPIYANDNLIGYSEGNTFTIKNELQSNQEYVFRIGDEEKTYFFQGIYAPPEAPTNFTVNQFDDKLRFTWNKSVSVDAIGYEIRTGLNWETSSKIGEVGDVDYFDWYPDMNNNYRFWIKTIDIAKVKSEDTLNTQFNVTNIDENINVVLEYNGVSTSTPADGDTQGLIFVQGQGYLPISSVTYDELLNTTYEDLNDLTYSEAPIFTSNVLDTTKIGLTKIRLLIEFNATLEGVTYETYPNRTYIDFPNDTYESITAIVQVLPEYSISDDNITFTDWITYNGIIDKTFRYIKFRYSILGDTDGIKTVLNSFKAILDVPDIEFTINDKTIVNSETIAYTDYTYDFYSTPRIIPVSKDNLNLCVISSANDDTFVAESYNTSGSQSTGTYDFIIRGY